MSVLDPIQNNKVIITAVSIIAYVVFSDMIRNFVDSFTVEQRVILVLALSLFVWAFARDPQ